MENNFFCPLPWNHIMFRSNGKVQACCETYDWQFNPGDTIAETANNPIMKQLRLDMLEPNKVSEMCVKCYDREQVLGNSTRLNCSQMHSHWTVERAKQETNADGSVDNFHLEHLDIRWSNLCNYRCRFCSIASSNLWLQESKLLGRKLPDTYNPKTGIAEYDMDWEDLKTHLPFVRYVKLAGGEPAIMPGTYQLLEELIRIGNTDRAEISFVTNASTIKYGKYDLLGLLDKFKFIKIQMSMEGMGARHEWARSGKQDWHQIEKNIQAFHEFAKKPQGTRKINFHTGISWMNMYHLADFIQAYPNIKFVFNLVVEPKNMSMLHFNREELQRCSDYYDKILDPSLPKLVFDHLTQVKTAIDNSIKRTDEQCDLDEFRRVQGILDKNRNQSFVKAYPEWSQYA